MKAITLFLLILSLNTVAQAKEEETSKSEKEESSKSFSQEELDKALKVALETELKKINPQGIAEFGEEMLLKEKKLLLKEERLVQREKELELSEKDLATRYQKFFQEQEKFIGCLDNQAKEVQGRVDRMVNVLAGMRPKNAADILSVQDDDVSVRILERLDPAKISKIFNSMEKEISARLQKKYLSMKK